MPKDPENQRKRKRLLVASIGVATVSFLGAQTGCNNEDDTIKSIANLLVPPFDTSQDPSVPRDAEVDAFVPPGQGLTLDAALRDAAGDALTTSGNLLPPPADAALGADAAADAARDAASDAAADAAKDAAPPKDTYIDTGLPSSGNLLPPLPSGDR
jgi:hypothetical protein